MIRIDALWACTAPVDMRAGADRLLACVVQTLGAAQRQLFLETLDEDEADLQAQLAELQARQSPPPVSPEKAPSRRAARRCPSICAGWSTTTSRPTPTARPRAAASR